MKLQMHSQVTSTPRVQAIVNENGDTLIQMNLVDAKFILTEVLDKTYSDSIITIYQIRDSLQTNSIILQSEEINLLKDKFNNQLSITDNLNSILGNKDVEINYLASIIKEQKKEIRKQKILKIIGFATAIVVPITTILISN